LIAIEPLTPEHFAVVAEWLSKPGVNGWLTSDWRDRTADPMLIGVAVRNKRSRFYLVRADGSPCGLVALADWDVTDKVAMIWYVLGDPESGGRGVISEAVRQLIQIAFGTLGLESLYAWIVDDNTRSRRVLERNGFREVGRLRSAVTREGRRLDRVYFDLPRGDAGY
jgi:RimJ/RimL family protein N-acetyltransferase